MKKTLLLFSLSFQILIAQDYTFYAISSDASTEKSIYLCKLNPELGSLSIINQYSGAVRGNYLALSSDNKHLLATSKNVASDKSGLIQYAVAEDGSLSFIKEQFKSANDLPCHVSFTPDMQYALSANYGDDEISLYYFGDRSLSPEIDNIVKPDQSKGHFICTDPSGKFVYAVFLGLNKVFNYTIEANKFKANPSQEFFSLPAGYGPRHLIFHPDKELLYILNETHSSVTACSYNSASGVITELQNISMLPSGYTGNTNAAAIRIHPGGKFLYGSNRGHNSIAVFKIEENGHLTFVEHETLNVNFPRDFNLSPDGKYMVIGNQKGNSVMSLTINEETGELTNTGFNIQMKSPVSILFLPSNTGGEPTGAHIISDENKFNGSPLLYPNPGRDIIHFDIPAEQQKTSIEIFSFSGQLVKNLTVADSYTMDVSELPEGSYLLKAHTSYGTIARKLILR